MIPKNENNTCMKHLALLIMNKIKTKLCSGQLK